MPAFRKVAFFYQFYELVLSILIKILKVIERTERFSKDSLQRYTSSPHLNRFF